MTEYVYRKFVVFADLTEWSSANQQGITTPNVWTQLKANDGALASLALPNVGWEALYLLLCTLPAEWDGSMELSAGALQEVATSRGKVVSSEQCKALAEWAACSESSALWSMLKMELRDMVDGGFIDPVQVGPGSLWLGDSVCLYYLLSKKSKASPAPIPSVLRDDLHYGTRFEESIAGGCKVGDYYRDTKSGAMVLSREVRLGFLSRVKEMVLSGSTDGQFAPPLLGNDCCRR